MSNKFSIPHYTKWHPGLTGQILAQMAQVWPQYAVLANMGWRKDGVAYLVQHQEGGDTIAAHIDGTTRVMPHDLAFYIQYGHGVRRCVPGYAATMFAALVDNKE